jgi:hypothetical protein
MGQMSQAVYGKRGLDSHSNTVKKHYFVLATVLPSIPGHKTSESSLSQAEVLPSNIQECVARYKEAQKEWRVFAKTQDEEDRTSFLESLEISQAESDPNPNVNVAKNYVSFDTRKKKGERQPVSCMIC